jgi:hypothetical protein
MHISPSHPNSPSSPLSARDALEFVTPLSPSEQIHARMRRRARSIEDLQRNDSAGIGGSPLASATPMSPLSPYRTSSLPLPAPSAQLAQVRTAYLAHPREQPFEPYAR